MLSLVLSHFIHFADLFPHDQRRISTRMHPHHVQYPPATRTCSDPPGTTRHGPVQVCTRPGFLTRYTKTLSATSNTAKYPRTLSSRTRSRCSRMRFTTSRRKASCSRTQRATQVGICSHDTSSSSTVHASPSYPLSTDIAVAGGRPVVIWNGVVPMRLRYAGLRARCTALNANGHSLGGRRLSLRIA